MNSTNALDFVQHWSSSRIIWTTLLTASSKAGDNKHGSARNSSTGLTLRCLVNETSKLKALAKIPEGKSLLQCGQPRSVDRLNVSSTLSTENTEKRNSDK